MEDTLTTLWENLSLIKNESTTINIDPKKLLAPSNALIGRLAMKKHVTSFKHEKGLRSMWEVPSAMDVTLLDEYLYMFAFKDGKACERVYEKQPWNYRGLLLLLDHIRGDECPSDFKLATMPSGCKFTGCKLGR